MRKKLSALFLKLPEGRIKNIVRNIIYNVGVKRSYSIQYFFIKNYWKVTSKGISLFFVKNPFHVYRYNSDFLYALPEWEPEIIIDAGSFYGTLGMFLAKKYPQSTVFLLEPDPVTYNILHENVVLNKLENVCLIKKGLWDKEETLYFNNNKEVASSIARKEGEGTTTINTISPAALLDGCSGRRIFFKMNIEGAEIEALTASIPLWKTNKIKFVISVDHIVNGEYTYKRVEEICRENEMSYKLRWIGDCIICDINPFYY